MFNLFVNIISGCRPRRVLIRAGSCQIKRCASGVYYHKLILLHLLGIVLKDSLAHILSFLFPPCKNPEAGVLCCHLYFFDNSRITPRKNINGDRIIIRMILIDYHSTTWLLPQKS